jgi:hypothetical protein
LRSQHICDPNASFTPSYKLADRAEKEAKKEADRAEKAAEEVRKKIRQKIPLPDTPSGGGQRY